jgi:hypothetical protein
LFGKRAPRSALTDREIFVWVIRARTVEMGGSAYICIVPAQIDYRSLCHIRLQPTANVFDRANAHHKASDKMNPVV